MKYFDTLVAARGITGSNVWASTVFDPTGTNCLFAPTQGAAINQRIGGKVRIMKIKIRGRIEKQSAVGLSSLPQQQTVRIMLVHDKQTNATQMTGTQLMMGDAAQSIDTIVNTYQNLENFGRFRVLKDKKFSFGNQNSTGTSPAIQWGADVRQFKFSYSFGSGMEIRFNATNGGTIADIVDNSFHIVANSNATGANLIPNISYVCRVCFKE